MADSTVKKFLSFDVFQTNEQWIHDYIDRKDASSLKAVTISSDGKKLLFYTVEAPTSSTQPTYSIEIPHPALDGVMMKLGNATVDNIATLTSEGSVKDSGVSINEIPTMSSVESLIAEKISQASHMKKQIVSSLPTASEADENTFYLIKIDGVNGKDKYEVWTLIGNELVLIDDTSLDLSGYADTNTMAAAITQAKAEAIADATAAAAIDATTKANEAVNTAKQYTDSQIGTVNTSITNLTNTVQGNTSSIGTINNTLTTHADRISDLEDKTNFEVVTPEEALAVFNSIFNPTGK